MTATVKSCWKTTKIKTTPAIALFDFLFVWFRIVFLTISHFVYFAFSIFAFSISCLFVISHFWFCMLRSRIIWFRILWFRMWEFALFDFALYFLFCAFLDFAFCPMCWSWRSHYCFSNSHACVPTSHYLFQNTSGNAFRSSQLISTIVRSHCMMLQ